MVSGGWPLLRELDLVIALDNFPTGREDKSGIEQIGALPEGAADDGMDAEGLADSRDAFLRPPDFLRGQVRYRVFEITGEGAFRKHDHMRPFQCADYDGICNSPEILCKAAGGAHLHRGDSQGFRLLYFSSRNTDQNQEEGHAEEELSLFQHDRF